MVTATTERARQYAWSRARQFLFPGGDGADRADASDTLYLRPLMTAEQKGIFLCLTAVWFVALAAFWAWWLQREHVAGMTRFFFNTGLILWSTLSPGYFVMIFWRSRVAAALPALPTHWRVAMVVTKAPSEPFEVVRETLEAMLAQDYPHDTWLADEDPSIETLDWCQERGVLISTRRGVAEYHRAGWPRRTRCKEGNLAYFYDHYGYQAYDFVVQLDADHVPAENYLIEMLKPFRDERVGYVSAPSICDKNAAGSWSARGRLYVEGGLHGALQAGYNGGLAPLCIGSHYAVRTRALREIGGIGPELAEDHSTTLIMNAHGWRGVHAFDAIAHGEGPPTFAAMITQEFQWARSLAVILFRYTRHNWHGLAPRLRGQFLFSQLWYPIFSIFMACSVVAPILALLTRHTWVAVFYPSFFVHGTAVTLAIIALMIWVRRNGWFRPRDAKVLSWEGTLFTFARWPWSLLGVVMGAYAGIARRELPFRVTPKGSDSAADVPPGVVLPYIGLSLASALPVLLIDEPGTAAGFYLIALLNAAIYLVIATVIVAMHRKENPVPHRDFRTGSGTLWTVGAMLCALALIIAAAWRHLPAGAMALAAAKPTRVAEQARAKMVADKPMFNFGAFDPQHQLRDATNLSIEHVFLSWTAPDVAQQIAEEAARALASRRWLLLTIEPWAAPGARPGQLLQQVRAGAYDARIDKVCDAVAQTGAQKGKGGIFLRWGHEMDQRGMRYPWQSSDSRAFVAAFRHFVTRCRGRIGSAEQVYFVWSPAGNRNLARYYPGSEFVDWIGLSVYDCNVCGKPHGAHGSFAEIVEPKYRRVRGFRKPVMIAEMGVDGGERHQRAWLKAALERSCALPDLRLLVYFNAIDLPGVWGRHRPDWHLQPEALAAIKNADARAMCSNEMRDLRGRSMQRSNISGEPHP